jgi:hypothetical protein
MNAEKQEWIQTVVPQWMNAGKEREKTYDSKTSLKE